MRIKAKHIKGFKLINILEFRDREVWANFSLLMIKIQSLTQQGLQGDVAGFYMYLGLTPIRAKIWGTYEET